ncbi:monocarboxylate transporter 13 [Microplitis demolitor]|uniref:monocarboxylate transporter 13 n=1 Tax=Microplitis demolitor TaxID=69319 RepID=UPI0004CCA217|nr:monocarboxylate transporter 13 [Microplitis demolitor]XP_053594280.1 monocarboxylate transporter 13 [Microplitis demolitor]
MIGDKEVDNGINIKIGKDNNDGKGKYRPISMKQAQENRNGVNGHVKNVNGALPEGEWVPPDGGWGWLILLAAVMVNVLIPGTIKSFGVLFVEFLNVFEGGRSMAAWIPALCYFLYSSLGPLSSILSVKYSYRTVTLIGGTFAAVGMMLSYFANSIIYLCVSYGVFLGIGAGLAFPPTVYIVTSYFLRLRGFANGLCISGSALGSIFLPPLLNYLLQEFGYRGAVLIMGGILLHVWAAALLYEPLEKHMKFVPLEKLTNEQVAEAEEEEEEAEETDQLNHTENYKNSLLIIPSIKTEKQPLNNTNNLSPKVKAVPKSASSVALENYKNTPVQSRTRKISMPTNREITSQMHSTPALHAVPERSSSTVRRKSTLRSPSISSFNYISTPYHGSTLSALQPEYASNLTLNAISSTFRKSPEKTIKPSNNSKNNTAEKAKTKFFDLSLLKDPIYLVILISNSTNAVSYTNFIILLPVYAISLGYDRNRAIVLLSLNSAFDLVGRIGGSALSDTKMMPKHWYFVGGLLISGIALTLMPTSTSYTMLASYCCIFGLSSGIYVGVTAVIMADMLGTEKLTSSYGISLFVNGIIQLVGPPICGAIFEHIGSYGPIFGSLGIVLIAGASLWACVPFLKKRQANNLELQASKV